MIGAMYEQLAEWRACPEALEWAKQFDSWESLWEGLGRADWAFWLLSKAGLPARELSLACYEVVKPEIWNLLVDDRSRRALEAVPRYWAGEISFEALREAVMDAEEAASDLEWEAADLWEPWKTAAPRVIAARAAAEAGMGAAVDAVRLAADAAAWAAARMATQVTAEGGQSAVWKLASAQARADACHLRMCDRLRAAVDISRLFAEGVER